MKTYLNLKNSNKLHLPSEFQDDDVRYSDSLVEYFLKEYTHVNDVVFDPFAGFGTTLIVAEEMGRIPLGIEFDEDRVRYIQSHLKQQDKILHGDSRILRSYSLPAIDFSMTSPPYTSKGEILDSFTAYTQKGNGYKEYLNDIRNIYMQIKQIMKPDAKAVIEVANIKHNENVTTLAWDVAEAVSQVLHFEGEIVVNWDKYTTGFDHSYCLVFSKKQ